MNGFITWEAITEFGSLTTIVFMAVEYIKELPIVSKVKTKYLSSIVSFILITLVNLHQGTFQYIDLTLYFLSSLSISLSANGLSDFNNLVLKSRKDIKHQ